MTLTREESAQPDRFIIDSDEAGRLIKILKDDGRKVIGPVIRDAAIIYDEIDSLEDLPRGWTDEQDGGLYRLHRRDDEAYFGYVVGPHSWKKFLHPPSLRLWSADRTGKGFSITPDEPEAPALALFGARSCELHAIAIQDKVFLESDFVDPHYASRRKDLFIVAVNCTQPGGTCFCVSMETGPRAAIGFDLSMTEVLEEGRQYFIIETGSDAGNRVLSRLSHRPARDEEIAAADRLVENAAAHMGRQLDNRGVSELLDQSHDHPRWDEVASRCLTCANCTMVCPTCFCTTVEDVTDLSGDHAERWRRWDSCFTVDFSYLHGGSVRPSARSRYRQWMTHKLGTWWDQFGTSGCVGCGRCITWCPVGIDITEEVRALRSDQDSI